MSVPFVSPKDFIIVGRFILLTVCYVMVVVPRAMNNVQCLGRWLWRRGNSYCAIAATPPVSCFVGKGNPVGVLYPVRACFAAHPGLRAPNPAIRLLFAGTCPTAQSLSRLIRNTKGILQAFPGLPAIPIPASVLTFPGSLKNLKAAV